MTPVFQRIDLRARIFAAMIACLLLVQTTISTAHAVALGDGVGAVCAPQDGAKSGAPPLSPPNRHCQGFCCILHDGALDAPPLRAIASVALNFPTAAVSAPLESSVHAPRIEPKGAPQSPRAPPRQG